MYRAVVVTYSGREALYVDGELVYKGGLEKDWLFWVRTFHHYEMNPDDICPKRLNLVPEDALQVVFNGFPREITKFNHDYTKTSV